jgi:hypothetical protein
MNEFLHVRLFPTRMIVLTKQFLQELAEKHDVADSCFSSMRALTLISTRHSWKS